MGARGIRKTRFEIVKDLLGEQARRHGRSNKAGRDRPDVWPAPFEERSRPPAGDRLRAARCRAHLRRALFPGGGSLRWRIPAPAARIPAADGHLRVWDSSSSGSLEGRYGSGVVVLLDECFAEIHECGGQLGIKFGGFLKFGDRCIQLSALGRLPRLRADAAVLATGTPFASYAG